ncbi:MAG: extracellular solute-binding protein [Anaerotignaceae bacterium]
MYRTLSKFTAFILAVTLAFCGCSGKSVVPKNAAPTTVTIWHYYNGAQKRIFDDLILEFNETVGYEKNIAVEAYNQSTIDALADKIMASANKEVGSEDMPDIFSCYSDTAFTLNEMDLLCDINKYLTNDEKSQYIESYLKEGDFENNGSIRIFPIAKSTEVLMLNKTDWDKFAAATNANENDLLTCEGITNLAESYYNWTDSQTPLPNDGKAFFGRDALANYMIIGSMQLGEEIFTLKDGNGTISLDKEIFRKLWDNYYVPFIKGYFTAAGRFRSDDTKTGDLIAFVGSTAGSVYFPKEVTLADGSTYPIEGEVYPMPVFENGENYATQQGAGMAVTASGEKRESAAVEFLKWFTDTSQNVEFSVSSGYLPVKTNANSQADLDNAIETSDTKISPILVKTLNIGVDMTKNYKLYTSPSFKNTSIARNKIGNSIEDLAKADYLKVTENISNGMSKDEALSGFLSDEYFDHYFNTLSEEIKALK